MEVTLPLTLPRPDVQQCLLFFWNLCEPEDMYDKDLGARVSALELQHSQNDLSIGFIGIGIGICCSYVQY
jgi:hypothetical protein